MFFKELGPDYLSELDWLKPKFADGPLGLPEFKTAIHTHGAGLALEQDLLMCFQMADAEGQGRVSWDDITNALVHFVHQDKGRDQQSMKYFYREDTLTLEPPPSLDASHAKYCPGLGIVAPFRPPRIGAAVIKVNESYPVVAWAPLAVLLSETYTGVLSVVFLKGLDLLVASTESLQCVFYEYSTLGTTIQNPDLLLLAPAPTDKSVKPPSRAAVGPRAGARCNVNEGHSPKPPGGGAQQQGSGGTGARPSQPQHRAKHVYRVRSIVQVTETHVFLATNPRGDTLVSGDRVGRVHLWDTSAIKPPKGSRGGEAAHMPATSAPASGGAAGSHFRLLATHADKITALRFSSETVVVAASAEGRVSVIDLETNAVLSLGSPEQTVTCVSWSEKVQAVVIGGWGGSLLLRSIHLGGRASELTDHLTPHRSRIADIRSPADAAVALSADISGTIKIWNLSRNICLQTLSVATRHAGVAPYHLQTIAFMPDASTLLVIGTHPVLLFASHHTSRELAHESDMVKGVKYMPGSGLVVTYTPKEVKVWHAFNGRIVSTHTGGSLLSPKQGTDVHEEISALCTSRCRKLWFVIGTTRNRIKMVHLIHGAIMKTTNMAEQPSHLYFHLAREWVIVGAASGVCTVLQNQTGDPHLHRVMQFSAGQGCHPSWSFSMGDLVAYYHPDGVMAADLQLVENLHPLRCARQGADVLQVAILGKSHIVAIAYSTNILAFFCAAAKGGCLFEIDLADHTSVLRLARGRVTHMAFDGVGGDLLFLGTSEGHMCSFGCASLIAASGVAAAAAATEGDTLSGSHLMEKLQWGCESSQSAGSPISCIAVVPHIGAPISSAAKRVVVWTDTLVPLSFLSLCTFEGYRFPVGLAESPPEGAQAAPYTHVKLPYLSGFRRMKGFLYHSDRLAMLRLDASAGQLWSDDATPSVPEIHLDVATPRKKSEVSFPGEPAFDPSGASGHRPSQASRFSVSWGTSSGGSLASSIAMPPVPGTEVRRWRVRCSPHRPPTEHLHRPGSAPPPRRRAPQQRRPAAAPYRRGDPPDASQAHSSSGGRGGGGGAKKGARRGGAPAPKPPAAPPATLDGGGGGGSANASSRDPAAAAAVPGRASTPPVEVEVEVGAGVPAGRGGGGAPGVCGRERWWYLKHLQPPGYQPAAPKRLVRRRVQRSRSLGPGCGPGWIAHEAAGGSLVSVPQAQRAAQPKRRWEPDLCPAW